MDLHDPAHKSVITVNYSDIIFSSNSTIM